MHTLLSPKNTMRRQKGPGPEIVPIQMGTSISYLLINGANSVLIDAGNRNYTEKVLSTLDKYLLPPQSIGLIVITHTHFDHCGSLSALKEICGAQILVHASEAQYLRNGYSPIPKGTFFLTRLISYLGRKLYSSIGSFPRVEPDIIINSDFNLQDFGIRGYILPTPGHTCGSISLILEDKDAFVGDTLFSVFPSSVFPPFSNDTHQMLMSWKRLINTRCKRFHPGHGPVITLHELEKAYEQRILKKSGKQK